MGFAAGFNAGASAFDAGRRETLDRERLGVEQEQVKAQAARDAKDLAFKGLGIMKDRITNLSTGLQEAFKTSGAPGDFMIKEVDAAVEQYNRIAETAGVGKLTTDMVMASAARPSNQEVSADKTQSEVAAIAAKGPAQAAAEAQKQAALIPVEAQKKGVLLKTQLDHETQNSGAIAANVRSKAKAGDLINVTLMDPATKQTRTVGRSSPEAQQLQSAGYTEVNIEATPGDMTNSTKSKIQEKLFNVGERIARVKSVAAAVEGQIDQMLTFQGRFKVKTFAALEKMGVKLNPEQREIVSDFSKASRRFKVDISLLMNELSGAAVSPEEATRIRGGSFDFEGDSPTEFKSKMKDTLQQLKSAQMRLSYLNKTGRLGDAVKNKFK